MFSSDFNYFRDRAGFGLGARCCFIPVAYATDITVCVKIRLTESLRKLEARLWKGTEDDLMVTDNIN